MRGREEERGGVHGVKWLLHRPYCSKLGVSEEHERALTESYYCLEGTPGRLEALDHKIGTTTTRAGSGTREGEERGRWGTLIATWLNS